MLGPIKNIKARALPMPGDDIDTDRIIPARFLRCVTFDGLGESAFYDERFSPDGKEKKHPMNEKKYTGAEIILSGNNFGCGSSREHAPQAIKRAGFKAVIAESFAEIFYGNSSVLGLVCVTMPKENIAELIKIAENAPETEFFLDIENKELKVSGKAFKVNIKDALRTALINGSYDPLSELMKNKDKAAELNLKLPPASFAV